MRKLSTSQRLMVIRNYTVYKNDFFSRRILFDFFIASFNIVSPGAPSDSSVSEDAGDESKTVATSGESAFKCLKENGSRRLLDSPSRGGVVSRGVAIQIFTIFHHFIQLNQPFNPASTEKIFFEFSSDFSVCFPLRPLDMGSERKFFLSLPEV
jgi:hypothetical protein